MVSKIIPSLAGFTSVIKNHPVKSVVAIALAALAGLAIYNRGYIYSLFKETDHPFKLKQNASTLIVSNETSIHMTDNAVDDLILHLKKNPNLTFLKFKFINLSIEQIKKLFKELPQITHFAIVGPTLITLKDYLALFSSEPNDNKPKLVELWVYDKGAIIENLQVNIMVTNIYICSQIKRLEAINAKRVHIQKSNILEKIDLSNVEDLFLIKLSNANKLPEGIIEMKKLKNLFLSGSIEEIPEELFMLPPSCLIYLNECQQLSERVRSDLINRLENDDYEGPGFTFEAPPLEKDTFS